MSDSRKPQVAARIKRIAIGSGLVLAALIGIGSASPQPKTLDASKSSSSQSVQTPKQSNTSIQPKLDVVTKNETQTKDIPFQTQNVNDNTLAKGQTKIVVSGVNGVQTDTYAVTYTNENETGRTLVSSTITAQPVTQVVHVGTYVAAPQPSCSNGSYINSAGNRVCSPSYSSSVPAGASAKCGDGTYSYSQSRSGTCSHHGGVDEWL